MNSKTVSKSPRTKKRQNPRISEGMPKRDIACQSLTYKKLRVKIRRLKLKRSWANLNALYPKVTRSTLRRIVKEKNYQPVDGKVLTALGLSWLPNVVFDVLAILHSGAPPRKLDRRLKGNR